MKLTCQVITDGGPTREASQVRVRPGADGMVAGQRAYIKLPGMREELLVRIDELQSTLYEADDRDVLVLDLGRIEFVTVGDRPLEPKATPRRLVPMEDRLSPRGVSSRRLRVESQGLVTNSVTGVKARVTDYQRLRDATGAEFQRAASQLATALNVPVDEAQEICFELVADAGAIARLRATLGLTDVVALPDGELVTVGGEATLDPTTVQFGPPLRCAIRSKSSNIPPTDGPLYVLSCERLYVRNERSDKVYLVLIVLAPDAPEEEAGRTRGRYRLVVAWGRRGATLAWRDVFETPVLLADLQKRRDLVVAAKTEDGYALVTGKPEDPEIPLPNGFVLVEEAFRRRARARDLRQEIGALEVVDGKLVDPQPVVVDEDPARADMRRARRW